MNKTTRALLLFFITLSLQSFSQIVEGKLTSNGAPVEFANILLYNQSDSSFVLGAMSDSTGRFSFSTPSSETKYYLDIQMIGLKPFKSEPFTGSKNFGNIPLIRDENQKLDEVTISIQKPMFEKTGRGMIVNVETSPVLKSGSTQDVLGKIPGIVVNTDGSLTLKGRSNVRIFMDGKPTFMSIEDLTKLLENTPADEIEKIEVFETPPAKFEAAGNAGIINIVRKKGKGLGFKGSLGGNTGYGNFHKFSPWAYLNYRSKKINTYGSGWYYNSKSDYVGTGNMRMIINDEESFFYKKGQRISGSIGGGSRAGIDYFLSDKNTIGYLGMIYSGEATGEEPSFVDVTGPAEDNYDYIDANEDFKYGWYGQTHNLNFKRQIKDSESLNIDIDFIARGNYSETSAINNYSIKGTALTPYYFEQESQTDVLIGVSKLDYEKTILKDWALETGMKASWVNTKNNFKAFTGTGASDAIEDLNQSNDFDYTESIYSAYGILAKKWKGKWSVDLALRIEHTDARGVSPTTDINFNRAYTSLFPNFSLSYTIPKKYNLSASATRRIQRPAYHQLNPFTSQSNQFNYNEGNPFLNPQYTDQINITWGIKDAFYFTLSGAQTLGLMTHVIEQEDSLERQTHSVQNLDDFYNYSLNATIPIKIKKWWSINLNGTLYNNKLKSNADFGTFSYELTSFNLQMQQFITLPKQWKFELSGFYNHDSYWNIYFVDPHYQLDLGLSKKIKNWRLTFALKDFLNIREGNGGVFQNNIQMPTTYKPESRIFRININYAFGNQGVKKERSRKTGSEDILQRTK